METFTESIQQKKLKITETVNKLHESFSHYRYENQGYVPAYLLIHYKDAELYMMSLYDRGDLYNADGTIRFNSALLIKTWDIEEGKWIFTR